jgi:uncharacterized membrane protein YkvI
MLPALLFFIAMAAFYPGIGAAEVPADVLLKNLDAPVFRVVFQLMIFAALLESGAGFVHALNERVASAAKGRGRIFGTMPRVVISAVILLASAFAATRFGLIALIASGYRALAYVVLCVYVVPLLTYGLWWIVNDRRRGERPDPIEVS